MILPSYFYLQTPGLFNNNTIRIAAENEKSAGKGTDKHQSTAPHATCGPIEPGARNAMAPSSAISDRSRARQELPPREIPA
jgi:hypothetical protein